MISRAIQVAAALLTILGPAVPSIAQTYKFTTYDYSTTVSNYVTGENVSGTIIENYIDKSGTGHCLMIKGKVKTSIIDKKGGATLCYGINKSGVIVGDYFVSPTLTKGFVYSGGVFRDILPPGAVGGAVAYGISDSGTIVGTFSDASAQHGFTLVGSNYKTVDYPGATATLVIAGNTGGQFTVQAYDAKNKAHSYLVTKTSKKELSFPGASSTYAHGINNKGQVALGWIDSKGVEHGGVYDSVKSVYYHIDYPKQVKTAIQDINDAQSLAGNFTAPGGKLSQGFTALGSLPK